MDYVLGGYQGLQNVCAHGSEHEADEIDDDDDDCYEFNLHSLLKADDKGHGHGQYREEELVIHAGQSAHQCDDCVQKSENMYDSGYLQGSHATQAQFGYEDKEFALNIQFFLSVRRQKHTIHPLLFSVRQNSDARVGINVYFCKLIIR